MRTGFFLSSTNLAWLRRWRGTARAYDLNRDLKPQLPLERVARHKLQQ